MIPSAFENVKRLRDDQLAQIVRSARNGDMTAIEALNLTSATPVLAEMMRRNRVREMVQKNMSAGVPNPKTVLDQQLSKAEQGVGSLEIPGMMEEQTFAGGGIVSFQEGGQAGFIELPPGAELEDEELSGDRPVDLDRLLKMTPRERHIYDIARIRREAQKEVEAETPVKPFTSEEQTRMFEERLKALQQITNPYQERMKKLIESGRIDESKRKEDLERSAYNQAFLNMIGARKLRGSGIGGSLANIASAAKTGLSAYDKGIMQLEEAKRLQARAEMDSIKAEAATERGNFSEARKYADDSTDAQNKAAQNYQRGIRAIRRSTSDAVAAAGRTYVGEQTAEARAAETARKAAEDKMEADAKQARTEAILKAALARSGGDGPRQMTENQFIASVAREEKSIRENSTRMAELRKQYGRGEALDDAIYRLAIDKVNRSSSERPGRPAPRAGEKPSGKPSATLPEGAVVVPLLP